MPTSAIGMSKASNFAGARSAGFTLIEILVVVVIIAIVMATAVLAVGTTGRDNELEKESERLLALVNYVQEQAEVRTREYGLLCAAEGYRFVTFDPRKAQWHVVDTDEALHDRELPDGLSLRLTVEARPIVFKPRQEIEDLTPQIMIYSNGDLTPFELTVERREAERSVTLASTDAGKIEAQPLKEGRT